MVTFALYKYNTDTDEYEYLDSQVTDGWGIAYWENLEFGDYQVTETETLEGYKLLAEPIDVTIPHDISVEAAEAADVSTDDGYLSEDGTTWHYIDLVYDVTNDVILKLPESYYALGSFNSLDKKSYIEEICCSNKSGCLFSADNILFGFLLISAICFLFFNTRCCPWDVYSPLIYFSVTGSALLIL